MWLESRCAGRALDRPRARDLLRRHLRRRHRRRRGSSPTSSPRRPPHTSATAASSRRSPRATTSSSSTRSSTRRSPRRAWSSTDVDAIAVTRGPGLIGALLVGRQHGEGARGGARASRWCGVDHLHGHVAANFLEPDPLEPPFLCLIASGGHTLLAGVARARRLRGPRARRSTTPRARRSTRAPGCSGLGYPGGPAIERAAEGGDPEAFDFPVAMTRDPGPRLQLQRPEDGAALRGPRPGRGARLERRRADLAASFQAAVVGQLVAKLERAARRRRLGRRSRSAAAWRRTRCCASGPRRSARSAGLRLKLVPVELCTDNAAMIASAARFAEPAPYPDYLGWDADRMTVVRCTPRPGCHLCDEARESDRRAPRSSRAVRAPRRSTSRPTTSCTRATSSGSRWSRSTARSSRSWLTRTRRRCARGRRLDTVRPMITRARSKPR